MIQVDQNGCGSESASIVRLPANDACLLHLIGAAIRAPSGDNTQPWRFSFDAGTQTLTAAIDETRDRSPMNAGQRMARLALGAAVENICRTAKLNFGEDSIQLRYYDNSVSVQLPTSRPVQPLQDDPLIEQRETNRRVYDRHPATSQMRRHLSFSSTRERRFDVRWVFDRATICHFADLIAVADAIMFTDSANLRAFLQNVRFDDPDAGVVKEGLCVASLELDDREAKGMRLLKWLPSGLLRLLGSKFGQRAKMLVESSTGLCLGIRSDNVPQTDICLGRAMQSAWLELTRLGLAVQPMMSLPVLEAMAAYDPHAAQKRRLSKRLAELGSTINALLGVPTELEVGFILRFGFAPSPSGRSARRDVHDFLACGPC